MRVFAHKKEIVILTSNGTLKKYSPFLICHDDEAEQLKKIGYEEVSELYNLLQIQALTEEVKAIKQEIIAEKENIKGLKQEIELSKASIDNYKNEISNYTLKLNDYISTFLHFVNEINSLYQECKEQTISVEEAVLKFNTEVNKITSSNIAELETQLTKLNNDTATNVSHFKDLTEIFINTHKDSLAQIKDSIATAEEVLATCKKWASNPVGVPVEDNLYSARHYATVNK